MQFKKRYLALAASSLSLVLIYYIAVNAVPNNLHNDESVHVRQRRSFVNLDDESQHDSHVSTQERRKVEVKLQTEKLEKCRMETCFDFSRCTNGFKVYVYPQQDKISFTYGEILRAIRSSRYYTTNQEEACVLIPSLDTLDRDKLSKEYVNNLQAKLDDLEHWNNGWNHLVFNLYSGTWPDYAEDDLGFPVGKAMLAKASISDEYYRPMFDISFPLFHKEHAYRGGEQGYLTSNNVPPNRKFTLVFKGKRYLTGIGSETRNSLYHIHNGEDIVMLTTCKHGKDWQTRMDERCEKDNLEYDKFDYKVLLHNSTYCLVPRGRRLGSYRFLESLQAACVPVLLSNGWVLPFSEVIDWRRSVVWGDERLLLQIPSIVRSLSHIDMLALRQQTQLLWQSYFSSIEQIVDTTLQILKDRVETHLAHTAFLWNSAPGALYVLPEYSQDPAAFPFFHGQQATQPSTGFTAMVYATCYSNTVIINTPLFRLVRNVGKSAFLHRIILLWNCDTPLPADIRWPVPLNVPIIVKLVQSVDSRFRCYDEIDTDAVLSLDEDVQLITDEVDFAYHVWTQFPERIVGFPARNHFWDESQGRWAYSSTPTNHYSLVLTSAAFYHRYYGFLYQTYYNETMHQLVDQIQNCEDLLMNFLVSHLTRSPPIKVTHRRQYRELPASAPEGEAQEGDRTLMQSEVQQFAHRSLCLDVLVDTFGYMPLYRSNMRLDPLLWKDNVSIMRKKYRQMERVL